MFVRKMLFLSLAVGMAAPFAVVSTPAEARTYVDIDVAPPAVREEVVPAPRRGYVWAPGYWEWHGHAHRWHKGYWVRERRGYHYVPAAWEDRHGRWHFVPGRWER